ncbi:putative Pumilio like protein [Blattamonas nauphoetae]|uniref:Pumilio like protein n=1 Tax=Blattamonas nauphoetae TaxID=2049346 RepID=A0ABQ9XZH7_9EUKA|nr:putative Pumilio like protein [Blattamonas nauphoetae]
MRLDLQIPAQMANSSGRAPNPNPVPSSVEPSIPVEPSTDQIPKITKFNTKSKAFVPRWMKSEPAGIEPPEATPSSHTPTTHLTFPSLSLNIPVLSTTGTSLLKLPSHLTPSPALRFPQTTAPAVTLSTKTAFLPKTQITKDNIQMVPSQTTHILSAIRQEARFKTRHGGQKGGGNQNSNLPSFPSSKESNIPFSSCYSHILAISEDQIGSRFLQSRLDTASSEEITQVFNELCMDTDKTLELMTHCFANYVIQKLFEVCNEDQINILLDLIQPAFLSLSFDTFGCRVLQCAIPRLNERVCTDCVKCLFDNSIKAIFNQNANHVLQKAIEYSSLDSVNTLISTIDTHGIVSIATHTYGCRVMQRMLEIDSDQIHNRIGTLIFPHLQSLVLDQYGNFVIQHLVQNSGSVSITVKVPKKAGQKEEASVTLPINESVVRSLSGHFFALSKHKFGSNVIEKCLEYSSEVLRRVIILEIMQTDPARYQHTPTPNTLTKDLLTIPTIATIENQSLPSIPSKSTLPSSPFTSHPLLVLLMDQFGNYVAQRVCDVAPVDLKTSILSQLLCSVPGRALRNRRDYMKRRSEIRRTAQRFNSVQEDHINFPTQDFVVVRIEKLIRVLEKPDPVRFAEPPRVKNGRERAMRAVEEERKAAMKRQVKKEAVQVQAMTQALTLTPPLVTLPTSSFTPISSSSHSEHFEAPHFRPKQSSLPHIHESETSLVSKSSDKEPSESTSHSRSQGSSNRTERLRRTRRDRSSEDNSETHGDDSRNEVPPRKRKRRYRKQKKEEDEDEDDPPTSIDESDTFGRSKTQSITTRSSQHKSLSSDESSQRTSSVKNIRMDSHSHSQSHSTSQSHSHSHSHSNQRTSVSDDETIEVSSSVFAQPASRINEFSTNSPTQFETPKRFKRDRVGPVQFESLSDPEQSGGMRGMWEGFGMSSREFEDDIVSDSSQFAPHSMAVVSDISSMSTRNSLGMFNHPTGLSGSPHAAAMFTPAKHNHMIHNSPIAFPFTESILPSHTSVNHYSPQLQPSTPHQYDRPIKAFLPNYAGAHSASLPLFPNTDNEQTPLNTHSMFPTVGDEQEYFFLPSLPLSPTSLQHSPSSSTSLHQTSTLTFPELSPPFRPPSTHQMDSSMPEEPDFSQSYSFSSSFHSTFSVTTPNQSFASPLPRMNFEPHESSIDSYSLIGHDFSMFSSTELPDQQGVDDDTWKSDG